MKPQASTETVKSNNHFTAKPIGLTMGDPAGIGPEIIAKLYLEHAAEMSHTVVLGDAAHMRRAAQLLSPQTGLPVIELSGYADLSRLPARCLPVMQACTPAQSLLSYGQVDARAGRMAADAVRFAAKACLTGELSAMVTAPLNKEALHAAGEDYPGHTELLQALAAKHLALPTQQLPVRMMLANAELRTVLHSIHISLRDAIDALDAESLLQTIRISHEALSKTLGRMPKIAVAGLNPHAGENGAFGLEEIQIINPVVAACQSRGWLVSGAHAPDTVFMRARTGEFDAVVALYHDQGLIPVKYLGLDEGVNVTLGLPLLRTSPDHGTAFDIAGSTKANAASMLAALRLARRLVANA